MTPAITEKNCLVNVYRDTKKVDGWVFSIGIAISLLGIGWTVGAILDAGASQFIPYEAETIWFGIFGATYLGLHGLRRMAWVSAPALLSIEALIYFALIPGWRFAGGEEQVDAGFAHAMLLVLVGFVGFWVGSLLLLRKSPMQFSPVTSYTSSRVALISAAMCGLGIAGNIMLWRAGLFSYLADQATKKSNQGLVQWLLLLADLLTASLAISAIEVLGKKSKDPLIKIVFVLSLTASIGFGLMSGMKGNILDPLLLLVLIYGLTNERLPKSAILLPVLLIVVVYPFVGAYRKNLNNGYRAQVDTVSGLEATLSKSIGDAFLTFGSRNTMTEDRYSKQVTSRLSYLSYVRDVVDLPSPSMLRGDERVWLAPLYPLIPRFIWKTKPVLDKGVRLNIALGLGDTSSSVSTPIGDLYAIYGAKGVAGGMFVWGVCLQLVMNWFGRTAPSEIKLFIYVSMIRALTNLEADVVGLIAGVVQLGLFVLIIAYSVYGRRGSAILVDPNTLLDSGAINGATQV